MEMQAIVDRMNEVVQRITKGNASQEDLESLVKNSAELHELAVIIRYKAYEAKVYGIENPAEPTAVVTNLENDVEELDNESSPETIIEKDTHEDVGFDLFSLDDEENTTIGEETPQQQPSFSTEINTEKDETTDFKNDNEVETATVPNTFSQSQQLVEEPTNLHPIFKKITLAQGTLTNRLMSSHLDTLNGAFSFNERLQIIQELFNGSGDDFTDLIDLIEESSDKNSSRIAISKFAAKYEWKDDSHLALEFIQKIERKYA